MNTRIFQIEWQLHLFICVISAKYKVNKNSIWSISTTRNHLLPSYPKKAHGVEKHQIVLELLIGNLGNSWKNKHRPSTDRLSARATLLAIQVSNSRNPTKFPMARFLLQSKYKDRRDKTNSKIKSPSKSAFVTIWVVRNGFNF